MGDIALANHQSLDEGQLGNVTENMSKEKSN
jgi:hypothetical protein